MKELRGAELAAPSFSAFAPPHWAAPSLSSAGSPARATDDGRTGYYLPSALGPYAFLQSNHAPLLLAHTLPTHSAPRSLTASSFNLELQAMSGEQGRS